MLGCRSCQEMPPGLWMDGRVSAAAVKFLTRIPRLDPETDNQLLFGHQTFAGLPPCQAKPLGSSLSVGIEATTTNQTKPWNRVAAHYRLFGPDFWLPAGNTLASNEQHTACLSSPSSIIFRFTTLTCLSCCCCCCPPSLYCSCPR